MLEFFICYKFIKSYIYNMIQENKNKMKSRKISGFAQQNDLQILSFQSSKREIKVAKAKSQSSLFNIPQQAQTQRFGKEPVMHQFNPEFKQSKNNQNQAVKRSLFINGTQNSNYSKKNNQNFQDVVFKKYLYQYKNRKGSQNFIIHQHQEHQKQRSRTPYFGDQLKLSKVDSPKIAKKSTFRKYSFNNDFLKFSKMERKNSDHNSGPQREIMKLPKFVKKKSMGWQQNNNFHFSMATNSSDNTPNLEQNSQNILNIPLPKAHIRKCSQNEQIKRTAPSFLMNKSHRKSIDNVQSIKKIKFRIQNFKILKDLGSGTFGRVVLAVQNESKMICAIKIISKRMIKQNNMVQQLLRELKIQSYVNHPNIVKVYGCFDDLLYFYIILQTALDGHLSDYISKQVNPITQLQCSSITRQICEAISYLHTQAVIHRDLKPQNILLHEGVFKITDFGWSVYKDKVLRTTFCGTPVYLSPEVLVGDQYDQSVDIWTIGVILYEMNFKCNPFKITCREQLINILNEPIYYDPKIIVSQKIKSMIQLCLKKKANQRPNIRQLLLHQFILLSSLTEQLKK